MCCRRDASARRTAQAQEVLQHPRVAPAEAGLPRIAYDTASGSSMEPLLAKPNYAFAKRQRDLAKKQKKEAKRQRKSESGQPAVGPDAEQAESDKKSDSQPS